LAAFPPLLGDSPTTLILGSMPGQVSLDANRYYAHPRNAFWYIMSCLCGFEEGLGYEQASALVMSSGICVWDVLYDCERKGSLDSNIERATELPNNFAEFFAKHPSIRIVGFNGMASRKIFSRHFGALISELSSVSWVDLPSTSPAYAVLNKQEKARLWVEKLSAVGFGE